MNVSKVLTFVAVFLVGAVAGRWIGGRDEAPSRAESGRTAGPGAHLSGQAGSLGGPDPADHEVREVVGEDLPVPSSQGFLSDPRDHVRVSIQELGEGRIQLAEMEQFIHAVQRLSGPQLVEEIRGLDPSDFSGITGWMGPIFLSMALAEENPEYAMRVYQDEEIPSQLRKSLGSMLFAQWGQRDPEAALRAVDSITHFQEQRMALQATLFAVASTDPGRALRAYEERDNLEPHVLVAIFRQWAQANPDGARMALDRLSGGDRAQALLGVVTGLARTDPDAALGMAFEVDNPAIRKRVLASAINSIAQEGFQRAARVIEQIPDENERSELIRNSIWALSRADPEGVIQLVQSLPEGTSKYETLQRLVGQLASSNPQRAADLVKDLPFGFAYRNAVNNLASQWGRADPDAALDWMSSLPAGEERDSAYSHVFGYLAEAEPERAMEMMGRFNGVEKTSLAEAIGQAKAKSDPAEAMDWARSLGDEGLVDAATESILNQWAHNDAAAVIDYLQKRGDVDALSSNASNLARNYARQDAVSAADWAYQLEPGDARTRALQNVAREWLSQNTYEASVWISQLPEDETRDRLAVTLIDQTYRSAPESAFEWALTLQDEWQRRLNVRRTVDELVKRGNADTARQLIAGANLPTDLRGELLERLD